jgi:hypothetical protein
MAFEGKPTNGAGAGSSKPAEGPAGFFPLRVFYDSHRGNYRRMVCAVQKVIDLNRNLWPPFDPGFALSPQRLPSSASI